MREVGWLTGKVGVWDSWVGLGDSDQEALGMDDLVWHLGIWRSFLVVAVALFF